MDFIEQYLGISPDGGDGSIEIMTLVLVVVLGALIGLLLPIARAPKKDSSPQNKSQQDARTHN